jgi:replicative DNA helicase
MAVIDYLQIIQVPGKASRFEKLGEISRGAKLLAKRLGIPVVLLAQISRDVERDNRRPLLSDIRECGNVEQDADIVLFTHWQRQKDRPEQYEMILAKQRNGPARQCIKLLVNGAHYLIGEVWEQGV